MNKLINRGLYRNINFGLNKNQRVQYCTAEKEEPTIPKNLITDEFNGNYQKKCGKPYDKVPFKIKLEKDKMYKWCLCGESKTQPMCDNTHYNEVYYSKAGEFKPIYFKVEKTKEYWLCQCKQTKNRPFCDGSHKKPEIQEMRGKLLNS